MRDPAAGFVIQIKELAHVAEKREARVLPLWPKSDTQGLFARLRRTSTIVAQFVRHKRLVGHGRCTKQRS
jgi:hypothetical protein